MDKVICKGCSKSLTPEEVKTFHGKKLCDKCYQYYKYLKKNRRK